MYGVSQGPVLGPLDHYVNVFNKLRYCYLRMTPIVRIRVKVLTMSKRLLTINRDTQVIVH